MIRHFIGPMSKNIVDAILQFEEETEESIGFIPSRRQVELDGGYVNNWTTEQFRKYVGQYSSKYDVTIAKPSSITF